MEYKLFKNLFSFIILFFIVYGWPCIKVKKVATRIER